MIRAIDLFYASKLRELRDRHGMKQYSAAQLLNISQQEYSDLESGKKNFSVQLVKCIFEAFNLNAERSTRPGHIELFRPDVFRNLSDPANEERVSNILLLFYERESIQRQLFENEKEIKARWKSLTGAAVDDHSLSIKIGYLNKGQSNRD